MTTIRRSIDLEQWFAGACAEFSDPSEPICQLFFRWQDEIDAYAGEELVCGAANGEFVLRLGPRFPSIPLAIEPEPRIGEDGALQAFGAEEIAPGVWSLSPSLNVPEFIHGFVVFYDVPRPAPWARRIILPGDAGWGIAA